MSTLGITLSIDANVHDRTVEPIDISNAFGPYMPQTGMSARTDQWSGIRQALSRLGTAAMDDNSKGICCCGTCGTLCSACCVGLVGRSGYAAGVTAACTCCLTVSAVIKHAVEKAKRE